MLEVKNLSFFYEKRKHFYLPKTQISIFENLNFSLNLGENFLIYGSSGSGKSTLGKIIAGLQSPRSGEVKVDSKRVLSPIPTQIQYIFQDQKTALNPYKKIKTLILDVAKNFNLTLDFPNLLASYGLDVSILDLRVCDLSSGEAQRVGILRALLPSPKILICDEILASLDLVTKHKMLTILKDYQAIHPISYVFISHSRETFRGFYTESLLLR